MTKRRDRMVSAASNNSEQLGTLADTETTPEAVGARLRLLRKINGMSQADLCAELGIHRPTWIQYETGRKQINVETAYKISGRFGVDFNFVFQGSTRGLDKRVAAIIANWLALNRNDL